MIKTRLHNFDASVSPSLCEREQESVNHLFVPSSESLETKVVDFSFDIAWPMDFNGWVALWKLHGYDPRSPMPPYGLYREREIG